MFQGIRIPAFHQFRRDRRGSILPMAAVTALVMFMLAGLAIDVSMIISAKNRIRRTMDAAGIAIATNFRDQEPTQSEVESFAVDWVQSNYPDYKIGEYFDLNVTWDAGQADLDAKVRVDTIFMDLIGATEIDANVSVQVISETRGLEIALALDNSGSMNGTEIGWLRKSVNTFLETLYGGDNTDTESVKVAMVPFVAAVNIKNANEFPNWIDSINAEDVLILDDNIDSLVPAVSYHGDIYNPRVSHAWIYKQWSGTDPWYTKWKGCVEARAIVDSEGNELDLTDVPPNASKPETLWVPYLWPDEPDNTVTTGGDKDNDPIIVTSDSTLPTEITSGTNAGEMRVRNNYLSDAVDESLLSSDEKIAFMERLESTANYISGEAPKMDEKPPITFGPNKSCPDPIEPLTSNYTHLQNMLSNGYLDAWNEGGTNIVQGLVWAWRVLSANEPFTQGASYTDADGNVNKKVEKVIVLFIDGGNGIVTEPNPVYTDYNAYSYVVPDGRLDPDGTNDMDTKLQKLCTNVREPASGTSKEKITIYAIGYDIDSADPVVDRLEDCTGDPDQVFLAADTEALELVFESLAKDLTKLRVVY